MLNRRIAFGRDDSRDKPHGTGSEASEASNRLIHGDNLAAMAEIGDGAVDLVYIDPPFGTGTVRKSPSRASGTSSDAGADPQSRRYLRYQDVPNAPEEFVCWLRPRLQQCHRTLAAHGSLFVHLDYRAVHYVKVELDRLFGRSRFVNELIWCYSVGGKSRRTFGRKHDTILWYAKSADYAFYPDAIRVPRKKGSHMRVITTEDGERVQEKTDKKTGKVYRYPVADGKIPEDWWSDIETLNRSDAERTGYPTQKPERLLERIIKATTVENALVADWFCGSATTAVVAQRLQRHFLCCDREQDAIECAADRLEAAGQALADAGQPPPDILVEETDRQPRLRGLGNP